MNWSTVRSLDRASTRTSTGPRQERAISIESNKWGCNVCVDVPQARQFIYIHSGPDINSAEGVPGMRTTVLTLSWWFDSTWLFLCGERHWCFYLFLVNKTTCIYWTVEKRKLKDNLYIHGYCSLFVMFCTVHVCGGELLKYRSGVLGRPPGTAKVS